MKKCKNCDILLEKGDVCEKCGAPLEDYKANQGEKLDLAGVYDAENKEVKLDKSKKENSLELDSKLAEKANEVLEKEESKRVEEVKKDEVKVDEVKKDEVKKDEVKKDEVKKDEVKKEEVKKEEVKKEEVKKEEVKKEKVKKEEIKKEDEIKSTEDTSRVNEQKKAEKPKKKRGFFSFVLKFIAIILILVLLLGASLAFYLTNSPINRQAHKSSYEALSYSELFSKDNISSGKIQVNIPESALEKAFSDEVQSYVNETRPFGLKAGTVYFDSEDRELIINVSGGEGAVIPINTSINLKLALKTEDGKIYTEARSMSLGSWRLPVPNFISSRLISKDAFDKASYDYPSIVSIKSAGFDRDGLSIIGEVDTKRLATIDKLVKDGIDKDFVKTIEEYREDLMESEEELFKTIEILVHSKEPSSEETSFALSLMTSNYNLKYVYALLKRDAAENLDSELRAANLLNQADSDALKKALEYKKNVKDKIKEIELEKAKEKAIDTAKKEAKKIFDFYRAGEDLGRFILFPDRGIIDMASSLPISPKTLFDESGVEQSQTAFLCTDKDGKLVYGFEFEDKKYYIDGKGAFLETPQGDFKVLNEGESNVGVLTMPSVGVELAVGSFEFNSILNALEDEQGSKLVIRYIAKNTTGDRAYVEAYPQHSAQSVRHYFLDKGDVWNVGFAGSSSDLAKAINENTIDTNRANIDLIFGRMGSANFYPAGIPLSSIAYNHSGVVDSSSGAEESTLNKVLFDSDLNTAIKLKPKAGQWVELDFGEEKHLIGFDIVNGWHANPLVYYQNPRIKTIKVDFGNSDIRSYNFDDTYLGVNSFYLGSDDASVGASVKTDKIRISVEEVYPGESEDAFLGISNIVIYQR